MVPTDPQVMLDSFDGLVLEDMVISPSFQLSDFRSPKISINFSLARMFLISLK